MVQSFLLFHLWLPLIFILDLLMAFRENYDLCEFLILVSTSISFFKEWLKKHRRFGHVMNFYTEFIAMLYHD